MTRGLTLTIALASSCVVAEQAAAQQVGDPASTVASVLNNRVVRITTTRCQESDATYWVKPFGGMTILASGSLGGPLLATVPIPYPNPEPNPEAFWCPGIGVQAVPPGTYWVVMVYGLTNQRPPASTWQRVDVGSFTCTQPPLLPRVLRDVNGNALGLAFSGWAQGCQIDRIDLEVGTTPGGREIGVFPLPGLNTFFPNVPTGTYYARARAVNAYGSSNRSEEVPLRFPGPCTASEAPPAPINPTVVANGSQVTFSWALAPGRLVTFHQFRLVSVDAALIPLDHFIVSSAPTLSVPNVPPGNYRVHISAGNQCGVTGMVATDFLNFTVP